MPLYDYRCDACGLFEAARSVAARDEAVSCPICTEPALRVTMVAPRLGNRSTDDVMNEADKGRYGMRHVSCCSCCC